MADTLTLLPENAPILRDKIDLIDIEAIGSSLAELSERLHATRRAHKAVGLAANQVGIRARMFVMGNLFEEYTCINPEIIASSESQIKYIEGCLSFPNLALKIERPDTITVRYINENLETKEQELTGTFARCFQHELDHLNGITFTEHVSKLVLALGRKKQAKAKRFKG
jgi:peptide deformylase